MESKIPRHDLWSTEHAEDANKILEELYTPYDPVDVNLDMFTPISEEDANKIMWAWPIGERYTVVLCVYINASRSLPITTESPQTATS